jgi:hypothetical protein
VANTTLSAYLSTLRFILHDVNSVTFSDLQLINCINLARDQIISDTSTPQAIVSIPLVNAQFAYPFTTILIAVTSVGLPARAIQSILGVNFYQSPTLGVPLEPLPWSIFNERYRLTPTPALPDSYAIPDTGGMNSNLYIGPPPTSSLWTAEVRCCWLGNPLANYTDVENVIPSPMAESLVPFLAAKWAWSFNNDEDMADKFEAKYERLLVKMAANMPPFSHIPFSSIYD